MPTLAIYHTACPEQCRCPTGHLVLDGWVVRHSRCLAGQLHPGRKRGTCPRCRKMGKIGRRGTQPDKHHRTRIADVLKRARAERSMTQLRFAKYLGVGLDQVTRWEKEESSMGDTTQRTLERVLGLPYGELA